MPLELWEFVESDLATFDVEQVSPYLQELVRRERAKRRRAAKK